MSRTFDDVQAFFEFLTVINEKKDLEARKSKNARDLMDIYYKTVGRNSVFLLNVPPSARGVIDDEEKILQETTPTAPSTIGRTKDIALLSRVCVSAAKVRLTTASGMQRGRRRNPITVIENTSCEGSR